MLPSAMKMSFTSRHASIAPQHIGATRCLGPHLTVFTETVSTHECPNVPRSVKEGGWFLRCISPAVHCRRRRHAGSHSPRAPVPALGPSFCPSHISPSPAEAQGPYVLQAASCPSPDANLQAVHQRTGSANQGGTVIRAAARRSC